MVKTGVSGGGEGAPGTKWAEGSDAIKYSTVQRTVPSLLHTTKDCLVQNVNNAKVETLWYKTLNSLCRKQCSRTDQLLLLLMDHLGL